MNWKRDRNLAALSEKSMNLIEIFDGDWQIQQTVSVKFGLTWSHCQILLALTDGKDGDGFPINKWEPIPGGKNIWAYFRHITGDEFFASAASNAKVEVIFEINWRNDINSHMRIHYKDQDYNITQIDNSEGYKTDLKIYASAVV